MKKILIFVINIGSLIYCPNLRPHEIFSLRADIARKDGLNIDTIFSYTKAGSQRDSELTTNLMYGAMEYLTLGLKIPVFLEKKVSEFNQQTNSFASFKTAGSGKVELFSKLRFYHNYKLAKRNQIVAVGGLLLPTTRNVLTGIEKKPIIDNNSMDFFLGAAGSFETTKYYHFASLKYRINTYAHSIREGDQFFYSYAFGYRPRKPDIKKLDWVFLIDVDGTWTDKTKVGGAKIANSGGTFIFIGPSFFCSKENFMLKGGIQIPAIQHVNGIQEKADLRYMVGIFIQF